jgi:Asp-tRNA(Asn)/Glu-tRNA(Gln) amidotransferase A subunit family amidase
MWMTRTESKRVRSWAWLGLGLGLLAACAAEDGPGGVAGAGIAARPPVVEATLAELQQGLHEGRWRCTDVVDAYLDRIARYDRATGLGAITEINGEARVRAGEIDAQLARGELPGPLFCAPILVKDNFDTADLPTTGGSIALAGSMPPDDATLVRRLRAAGAIVLAKTNMAEWAFSPRQTLSSSYGRTANAYALDRVPAGSSGGTASGVAASFGVAGLGSDTGNSIRGPSSHLALFGIRSTLGLTSRDGIIPLVFDRDVGGPMTRTVEDGARLFDVIVGSDPADPYTAEADAHREASYLDRLRRDGLRGARIGVLRALVPEDDTDPEVRALFELAPRQLAAAGAEIVDPVIIEDFEAHRSADNFCNRFRYDLSVYLASLEAPPFLDVRSLLGTDRVAPENADALAFFSGGPLEGPPPTWNPPCPEYADHPGRQAFLAAVVAAMDGAGVDALAYPSWTYPPAHLDRANEEYRGDNSQRVAPATGMPAVTVPMGFTGEGRLPAGLQLLGRRWDDGLLIQFAYAYEQATRHRRPPPAFPPLDPR